MRIDRTVSIHLAAPMARILRGSAWQRVPILMYHSIGRPDGAIHAYYETATPPQIFRQQMRFLAAHGYTALSLTTAVRRAREGALPQRTVVLTFDDGFQDFYTEALPVLRELKFTATVFIITGLTGPNGLARRCFKGVPCLTWDEVKEAHASGVEIGSHTVTHRQLATLSEDEMDQELTRSKQIIEQVLRCPVGSFSYPFAFPETNTPLRRRLTTMLEKRGYESGVSTIIGTARLQGQRFVLPRIPVNGQDDLRLFQAKLEGGYDWLHLPQRLYKQVRGYRPEQAVASD